MEWVLIAVDNSAQIQTSNDAGSDKKILLVGKEGT